MKRHNCHWFWWFMAAIYPQCNSTDFAAVTSRLNLAWYFYQEKEQNLKRTDLGSGICFLLSHFTQTSLSYVSSSSLFSDTALVVFFFYPLFATGLIDNLSPVMCLLSYKITNNCCLELLLFSLYLLHTEWVVFWPVNTTEEFISNAFYAFLSQEVYFF